MAYWLMKSEPDAWSWDQQVKAGAKGTEWTGVRNHSAKLNLMKMKKGDRGFFYHSNEGKAVVGIVEIIREHHPDPTAEAGGADAEPRPPRGHQERAEAQGHGAGEAVAPFGRSGDARRVENRLQDGR